MLTLLFGLVLSAPALAAPAPQAIRLTGGARAEDQLRRFVAQDARLKARLDEASRREEYYLSEARESDLRDAVSDRSAGENRNNLLATLPGMKAFGAAESCRSVAECPTPDLALDVADAEHLPDSLRRLVRPWMVLQQARGSALELSALDGPGDAALSLSLKGLDVQPLILNVSPRLLGGFKVWFERPLFLASLYGRERDAVVGRSR